MEATPVDTIRAVATHVSVLLFWGERVYKFKRALKAPFIDLSTPELRREACRREVELNRRLAPDVYLGVGELRGPDGCEPVVVMRRMPEDRRLSLLLHAHDIDERLRDIVRQIAALNERAMGSIEMAAYATRGAIRARWLGNLDELAGYPEMIPPETLAAIRQRAVRFLDGRGPLFEDRIERGRIRDGHGDLLADDIFCLDTGVRILDCLEFDDRLRYIDETEDCASLAVDLERLGRPDLAVRLFELFAEFTGDEPPESLRHHYMAYRALVRAKVGCMQARGGDASARRDANALAELVLKHLDKAAVRLVLVGGPPGTGKSTLAADMAAHLGWPVLSSDRIRRETIGANGIGEYGEGVYAPGSKEAVYDTMLERARGLLELGRSAILDATWSQRAYRIAAEELAGATRADLVELRCAAPLQAALARVARRSGSESDATPEVTARIAREFDAWPTSQVIDTQRDRGAALWIALAAVSGEGQSNRSASAARTPSGPRAEPTTANP